MKAWFKKHWKDCLIVFIIALVFTVAGIINIKAAIAKRERRNRTSKLIQEIEKGIERDRQTVIKLLERCQPCLTGAKK